jgi:hypothetical protein
MNKIENSRIVYQEISNMNESERENFSVIANKLLQVNYFVKKKKYLDDYLFTFKFRNLFSAYFGLSDYQFGIDEKNQVVYIHNSSNFNKLNLKKLESVVILALRLLYFKKEEKVTLSNEIEVNLIDLHFELSRVGYTKDDERVKKSELYPILRMYRKYNIIDFKSNELNDEARIQIYPSILYAINMNTIKETLDAMKAYKEGEPEYEEID